MSDAGEAIRRRRECLDCHARFTTFERYEQSVLWVVKRDGSRQPFEHAKLLRGLERACVKRPVALETVERIVEAVEAGGPPGRPPGGPGGGGGGGAPRPP